MMAFPIMFFDVKIPVQIKGPLCDLMKSKSLNEETLQRYKYIFYMTKSTYISMHLAIPLGETDFGNGQVEFHVSSNI